MSNVRRLNTGRAVALPNQESSDVHRLMPLRRGSNDLALQARSCHRLQLLAVPPHRRTLGLLRVWHGQDRRPPRSHRGVHLGRQNAAHHSLQSLWVRYALGALAANAWRETRGEPRELRSRTDCFSASSTVRRSEYLEIHRRVVQSLRGMASETPHRHRLNRRTVALKEKDIVKPIANLDEVAFTDIEDNGYYTSKRAQFSDDIGAKKLGYNLTELPPGKAQFPFHSHHGEEEMFLILEGQGELRFGNQRYAIRKHDVIGCPTGGAEVAHQIINTGTTRMRYLALSNVVQIETCEYPDSNKIMIASGLRGESGLSKMFRSENTVEYYDRESTVPPKQDEHGTT